MASDRDQYTERTCPQCGLVKPTKNRAKYCSVLCRQRAEGSRRGERLLNVVPAHGAAVKGRWPYRATVWADADLLWAPHGLQQHRNRKDRWRAVFEAIASLSTLRSSNFVWRGQADARWPLQASIHRKLGIAPPVTPADISRSRAETVALIRRAQRHRHDHQLGWDRIPDLPLLALLQHNGAATPLVDVTTDPAVAIFFAAQPVLDSEGADTDGLVLAIDVRPHRLGPWHPRAVHFEVGEDQPWEVVNDRMLEGGITLGLYTPPMVTPRIMAQRGRFIFGEAATSLAFSTLPVLKPTTWSAGHLARLFGERESGGGEGRLAIPPVVGIVIPSPYKPAVREVLAATYGLTTETLFPDLGGFASAHSMSAAPLTSMSQS